MKVDLHCHSLASDGSLTPSQLVARAHDRGVEMLALTDHDTIAGLPEAEQAARRYGIHFIPGIELSCRWSGVGIHVVGLGISPADPVLVSALQAQAARREERAQTIGRRLAKLGFADCYAGARQLAGTGQIGRPHFAAYLVEQGYVPDQATAFRKYLGAGKVGDVKSQWPLIDEAVQWIRAAEGVAVLAHPDKYRLTGLKLRRLLTDFRAAGGVAMEVVSGQQNPQVTQHFAGLCEAYELEASCGSDFHTPLAQWCDLGKIAPLPKHCRPVWQRWRH